jgi:DNA ligase-1
MLLNDLVEVSTAVASTRSRTGKRDLIAALLMRLSPDEVEIATAYLAGLLRQRRTGVGWRSLTDLPPPASTPTVGLTEVDATLESLEKIAGAGSANKRRDLVDGLFTRLTAAEQDYLRALITGSIRQGAQDAIVLEAIAAATGLSIAVVRRAAMFSAPTGPVALAALTGGEEALADFTLVAGRPVRPMLASSAPDVAAALEKLPAPVAVDTKLDGIRIQVHKRDDEVTVFSRSLDDIGDRLPGVISVVRSLPARDLILDGEALMLDDAGRPRLFQETASSSANHAGDSGLRPWFFDILLRDDVVLLDEPLGDRLAVLDDVVPVEHRVGRLEGPDPQVASDYFDAVVAAGHEGVVVKDLGAPYAAGRRGSAWVKVKPRHTLDLVVLAVEWGSGRRRGLLSNIHLGARDPETDGWVMLGKTFKGMTDEMLAWQTERFLALETRRERHVVHLRPEQVVEIAFDGVQRSTRYPGGVALRFARVLRYRDDKNPAEADTIDAVRSLLGGATTS